MKKSLFVLCLAAAFGTRAAITETTTDETASGDRAVTVAAGGVVLAVLEVRLYDIWGG